MVTNTADLKVQYAAYKLENPKSRIREAAAQLHVSEAELVATGVGETAIRLAGDFRELLKQVTALGHVMALTRNDSVVHERKGVYEKVSFTGQMGLVLGDDIDLRLFMSSWAFGFAVNENDRRSLQFFTADGEAVHKIYLTEHSNQAAYNELVEAFQAPDQPSFLVTIPAPNPSPETPDSDIAVTEFQDAWRNLQDTHDFFGMLRKFKVARLQAMRLAPEGLATQTSMEAVRAVFGRVSETGQPIMVFVGNRGCIQIHTGPVKKLVTMGPWFNVLDPAFNLHLREDHVASAWVVKKPTADGIVTSLELFDATGAQIAQIFGKRKPGQPEQPEWQQVVADLALSTH